jgi:dienelactone hydrolase
MAKGHPYETDGVFPSQVEAQGHPMVGPFQPLTISTARGPIQARLYEAPEPLAGVVLVGGVGGGFDTPADRLYGRLGEALNQQGISVLRVCFRHPTELAEAVHDILAGCRILLDMGVERLGLVGHSFGGAAVIQAAAWDPEAVAIVTLATQSYGAEPVSQLRDRHLLLIHGTEDHVLRPVCSKHVQEMAGDNAELMLIDGAGHNLDEAAPVVLQRVSAWLQRHLTPAMSSPGP